MKDAIAYIDRSKTGFDLLSDAIIAKWKETGEKPTVEAYGEELLAAARSRLQELKQAVDA